MDSLGLLISSNCVLRSNYWELVASPMILASHCYLQSPRVVPTTDRRPVPSTFAHESTRSLPCQPSGLKPQPRLLLLLLLLLFICLDSCLDPSAFGLCTMVVRGIQALLHGRKFSLQRKNFVGRGGPRQLDSFMLLRPGRHCVPAGGIFACRAPFVSACAKRLARFYPASNGHVLPKIVIKRNVNVIWRRHVRGLELGRERNSLTRPSFE